MAAILDSAYHRTVKPRTLEKRIQEGRAPEISLPITFGLAQCHYIVDRLTRPGSGGSDGILSVLFALGLAQLYYSDFAIRADLRVLVESTLDKRVSPACESEQARFNFVVQAAGLAEQKQTEVNRAIRGAGATAGLDKKKQRQDLTEIWTNAVDFRDGNADALGPLLDKLNSIVGPGVTSDESRLILARYNLANLLKTVDHMPLDVLYETIYDDCLEFQTYARHRASAWAIDWPEAIKQIVVDAIAKYTIFGSDLAPVIDSEGAQDTQA